MLKIDVNYKQVGSDRLANAISISKKNKNFVILTFIILLIHLFNYGFNSNFICIKLTIRIINCLFWDKK